MKVSSVPSGHSPRQIQIEDCLLENLKQQPYASVSISALCRQVGISRRAFYLYFKDKDDCLYALIDRIFRTLLLETYGMLPENASDLDACRTHLLVFQKYHEFFHLIVFNNQLDNMVSHIIQYAIRGGEYFLPTTKVDRSQVDPDLLTCLICSQIVLMLRWHYQHYETPIEEMALKLLKLTDLVIP